jgi:hypothetical protein
MSSRPSLSPAAAASQAFERLALMARAGTLAINAVHVDYESQVRRGWMGDDGLEPRLRRQYLDEAMSITVEFRALNRLPLEAIRDANIGVGLAPDALARHEETLATDYLERAVSRCVAERQGPEHRELWFKLMCLCLEGLAANEYDDNVYDFAFTAVLEKIEKNRPQSEDRRFNRTVIVTP